MIQIIKILKLFKRISMFLKMNRRTKKIKKNIYTWYITKKWNIKKKIVLDNILNIKVGNNSLNKKKMIEII